MKENLTQFVIKNDTKAGRKKMQKQNKKPKRILSLS